MSSTNFCYWLQGFFEMTQAEELTPMQVEQIKDHLKLVFKKETPEYIGYDLLSTTHTGNSSKPLC
jgi:hypothetical protein